MKLFSPCGLGFLSLDLNWNVFDLWGSFNYILDVLVSHFGELLWFINYIFDVLVCHFGRRLFWFVLWLQRVSRDRKSGRVTRWIVLKGRIVWNIVPVIVGFHLLHLFDLRFGGQSPKVWRLTGFLISVEFPHHTICAPSRLLNLDCFFDDLCVLLGNNLLVI